MPPSPVLPGVQLLLQGLVGCAHKQLKAGSRGRSHDLGLLEVEWSPHLSDQTAAVSCVCNDDQS